MGATSTQHGITARIDPSYIVSLEVATKVMADMVRDGMPQPARVAEWEPGNGQVITYDEGETGRLYQIIDGNGVAYAAGILIGLENGAPDSLWPDGQPKTSGHWSFATALSPQWMVKQFADNPPAVTGGGDDIFAAFRAAQATNPNRPYDAMDRAVIGEILTILKAK